MHFISYERDRVTLQREKRQFLSTQQPQAMVHTSRFYQYASYEEFRDNGLFYTEANCKQFLYDMKILRTHQKCPSCSITMTLTECPLSKYRDGSCWKCTCGRTIAPRVGSILQQSRITYKEFIKILAHFSNGVSVKTAAEQANLAENTVRRFFNSIHERIAEDVTTKTKIGGLGTVVEIDESKFSPERQQHGRYLLRNFHPSYTIEIFELNLQFDFELNVGSNSDTLRSKRIFNCVI